MICISTETTEEREELRSALAELHITFVEYQTPHRIQRLPRYLSKLADSIALTYYLKKKKSTHLIGGPCLRNRMARAFLTIKYAAYVRSLHLTPEKATSLSDKLYFLTRKVLPDRIANPYYADRHFISSEVNRCFLAARGIHDSTIKNIGAIWIDKVDTAKTAVGEQRIILIAQAFIEHNNLAAHEEQIQVLNKISLLARKDGKSVLLRKHPRDKYDYRKLQLVNVTENCAPSKDFISSIGKNDLIITPLSTLAFELISLGANVHFINLETIQEYSQSLSRLNIIPLSWRRLENLSDITFSTGNSSSNVFESKNLSPISDFIPC